ncbi:MAG: universal stress protein [Woeseiaceae bacterium]|nr:universal stress protein [Woeseiaceae bacterium]
MSLLKENDMTTTGPVLVIVEDDADAAAPIQRAADYAHAMKAPLMLLSCIYDSYLAGVRFEDAASLQELRHARMRKEFDRLEGLAGTFRDAGGQVETRVVWDKPRHEAIVRQVKAVKAELLVMRAHHHNLLERSLFGNPDWQLLRVAPCPMLLVKREAYGKTPRIWAAVDPLHQNDKPAELDERLFQWGRRLEDDLDGDLHVVHAGEDAELLASLTSGASMAVPQRVDELQEMLDRAHRDRLEQFRKQHDIDADKVHLLKGPASKVLLSVADEHAVDVMVLGVVSRSIIERAVVGNTAERVLEKLPCDLLVVKPGDFEPQVEERAEIEMICSTRKGKYEAFTISG